MADHLELVSEMFSVEKMSTADRLKHAKKRRHQQIKKFVQYEKLVEKESSKKRKTQKGRALENSKNNKYRNVKFISSIMLLEAAARNDIAEVRALLERGVDPNVTNEDGLTALHQCCIDDYDEMLHLLIEYHADVNARDSELWTPLHAAATCGHVHLCSSLIQHGGELLAVNADGNMPYDICEDELTLDYIESEMAKKDVTQDLIEETRLSVEKSMLNDLQRIADSGGALDFRDRVGATPLHVAAANGYMMVAVFLLDKKIDPDATDDDSWQPIHAAACWGHLDVLHLLLRHGADLDAKTKNGETPLDICEDPELRTQILEMKDEMENHENHKQHKRQSKNTRSSNIYNSNSSLSGDRNQFSASVRRTSIREKSAISRKEARDEASHLRDSVTFEANGFTEDEEEENMTNQEKEDTEKKAAVKITEDKDVEDLAKNNNEQTESQRTSVNVKHEHKELKNIEQNTNNKSLANKAIHSSTTSDELEDNLKDARQEGTRGNSNKENKQPMLMRQRSSDSAKMKANLHSEVSRNEHQGAKPHGGTLADLKKQRAMQLQNSMRFKDSAKLENEMRSYGAALEPNSTNQTLNGHMTLVNIPGDPPKQKFTAPQREIIGEEDKGTCCSIQ